MPTQLMGLLFAPSASAPSVLGGTVYAQFGGESGVNSPYMVGINAANGQQAFSTSYQAQYGYANQPTVIGNQVFGIAGYYGGVQGYNAITGATSWSTSLPQQTSFIPAADSTNIYIYMGSGNSSPGPQVATFYAINRATGVIAYTITNPAGGLLGTASVVLGSQNDALVLTTNSNLVSFNLANHTINWQTNVTPTGTIAVSNGKRIRSYK